MNRTKGPRPMDTYLAMVRQFPLRRIRTEADYEQAMRMYRRFASDEKIDSGTVDYLDVLVDLIGDYERDSASRFDTSSVTASELVRHLLEERGMSVSALARKLGTSQGTLNDMMNGRREWSKSMILKVSDYLGLDPGLFLRRVSS